jgi:hypothetical protein
MKEIGRGGGDRTKSDVENAQIIDSINREKRQKHRSRPTEVHAGYTELGECGHRRGGCALSSSILAAAPALNVKLHLLVESPNNWVNCA